MVRFLGGWLRQGVNAAGLGRPAPPSASPSAHADHDTVQTLPWSMRDGTMPMAHHAQVLSPDRVATIAAAPWVVTAPVTRVQDSHVLFIDPATGAVLQDLRYADFGKSAQAIEWGIYTHQGQQYGEANRLVMLAGCVGVWLLALSAPILWWKRRGDGRLSSPPRPMPEHRMRGVTAVMLGVGALFPLTGVTMVAALLGERAWGRYART